MKVSGIGEFGLIDRISRKIKDKKVRTQIGDDTAVLKTGKKFLLFTTDTLVEGDHFSREWFTPFQIGKKAMEINVSDIAATGGIPKYVLISLCLPEDMTVEFVEELYRGIRSVGSKYGFEVIGGNVTHAKQIVVDVCMVGETKKPVLRSGAKVNDMICVTGDLGKSKAGLELLTRFGKNARKDLIVPHIEPRARLRESGIISRFANSMIDVSDGLAPEVRHICELSKKGAVIWKEKIPVSKRTKESAKILGKDPRDFALYGGEDFELVFTLPEKNVKKIKGVKFSVVGKILPESEGIILLERGEKREMGKGYDHFYKT